MYTIKLVPACNFSHWLNLVREIKRSLTMEKGGGKYTSALSISMSQQLTFTSRKYKKVT